MYEESRRFRFYTRNAMIIVFGSMNVDVIMSVPSMPRPGDTVLCPAYTRVAGGKGANQALAAARAGGNVKLFGKVGADEFGREALINLKEANVDLTGVTTTEDASTGCAMICVDPSGENMITVASGANMHSKQDEVPDFLLDKGNTLLLQMETPCEENWKLIKRAKKYGAQVILNLAPAKDIPIDIIESLDVLILNQIEATTLALHLGFDVISPSVAARRIAANFGIICVVTLGADGSLACSPNAVWEVKAMDINAQDTTAAGDAFVGVLAASLDSGAELPLSLRRASAASGLACGQLGAQTSLPSLTSIDQSLNRIPLPRKIA